MTTKRKITAFRTKISLQMNHSYQKNTVSGKYNPLSEQGLKIRYLEIQSINGRNYKLIWQRAEHREGPRIGPKTLSMVGYVLIISSSVQLCQHTYRLREGERLSHNQHTEHTHIYSWVQQIFTEYSLRARYF